LDILVLPGNSGECLPTIAWDANLIEKLDPIYNINLATVVNIRSVA
jgi:hypothetical protein